MEQSTKWGGRLNMLSTFNFFIKKIFNLFQIIITMDPEHHKSFIHDYVQAAVF